MKKVVYFGSDDWCKSCVAMKPLFKQECEKLNVEYEIIDVESDRGVDLSTEYKVRNIPTLIFLDDDNKVIGRASGSNAYTEIKNYL
jgi:thiol-disulfide isomerase/thioredoxin